MCRSSKEMEKLAATPAKWSGSSSHRKRRIILYTASLVSISATNPETYKRLRLTFTVLTFFSRTKKSAPPILSARAQLLWAGVYGECGVLWAFMKVSRFFFCCSKAEAEPNIADSEPGSNLSGAGWDSYLKATGSEGQLTNQRMKRDPVWDHITITSPWTSSLFPNSG